MRRQLLLAVLLTAPVTMPPTPPEDEQTCAVSTIEGIESVATVQQSTEPVKMRLSIWQRFRLFRARRPYVLVQP